MPAKPAKIQWKGAFAALVTPFARDGAMDVRLLRDNLQMTVADGAHGVMVGGQYGEGQMMTDVERERLFSIAAETIDGRIPVIAASGHIGTAQAIQMTQAAKQAGVDGVMIEPPYFILPNRDEVVAHYAAIADAVDIPIKLCNSPTRCGFDLTIDVVRQLVGIPGIVAIKHSGGDFQRILQLVTHFEERLAIFIGPSRLFGFCGILMGADGFVDGLIQIAGRKSVDLYEAAVARDVERGVRLQRELFLLGEAIYDKGTPPATTKDAMRLLGRPGGWPRAPLNPAGEVHLREIRKTLEQVGLLTPTS